MQGWGDGLVGKSLCSKPQQPYRKPGVATCARAMRGGAGGRGRWVAGSKVYELLGYFQVDSNSKGQLMSSGPSACTYAQGEVD